MIDDEERRKVKKRVTEEEMKETARWREKVTRFVYLFNGGSTVGRVLCIYGVYRGAFIRR